MNNMAGFTTLPRVRTTRVSGISLFRGCPRFGGPNKTLNKRRMNSLPITKGNYAISKNTQDLAVNCEM
jgi:hypothetical protein